MRILLLCMLSLAACRDKAGESDDTAVSGDADPDSDGDGYPASDDCDDADATANPAADESCDGIDNNCDGVIDDGVTAVFYRDGDGDGFGDEDITAEGCEAPDGYVDVAGDCDDRSVDSHPDASERCDDEDNDCDGDVDEDVLFEWYADADGDGYGDPDAAEETCDPPGGYVDNTEDCDDLDGSAHPGAAEVCDEVDNDCDGDTDEDVTDTYYLDNDSDGYGLSKSTTEACSLPAGYADIAGDCDDSDRAISPSAAELCDSVDNDCDNATDEDDAADALTWYADADSDGYGDASAAAVACAQPSGHVSDDTDCDDSTATTHPGAGEYCDSIDNDCDGNTDEDDAVDATTWYIDIDADGYGWDRYTLSACSQPSGYVSDDTDCDDLSDSTHPDADEYCDEADNDCDGTTDEDDAVDASSWYADGDEDGYGDVNDTTVACEAPAGYLADSSDCDDNDDDINPGVSEACDDEDNDCDGDIDEEDAVDADTFYPDGDGDGYGDQDSPTAACTQPSGYLTDGSDCDDSDSAISPDADEVCDSADNNCDGETDEVGAIDGDTWYLDADGDGYGTEDDTVQACSEPSGYADNSDDCNDNNASVSACLCDLASVDYPDQHHNLTATQGLWTTDPLEALGSGLIWTMPDHGTEYLYEYASLSDLQDNNPQTSYTLDDGSDGTGAVVYDGYLYYNQENTRTLVKWDIENEEVVDTMTLTNAGYHNTYHYQWGGYSDIDLAVDEQGLWAIYATSANSGRIVISKIDPDTFSIEDTWNTSSAAKRSVGNAFMICGVLYTTASYNASTTTINYSYDTNNSTDASLSITFYNPGNYNSMIDYNHNEGVLYSWDDGLLLTYDLTIY